MKISCDREKLLQAFQAVASVAPTRSPKPILQNVKIEASQDKVTLLATDMEVAMRLDVVGIDVEKPGAAILPVVRFGSILREVVDEKLSLEVTEKGTTVRGERSEFLLSSGDPEEFPAVSAFEEDSYYEVPARLLKELIRRTMFATDVESSRYALGGVLFEFEEETMIAVGTDGRRLAKMQGPVQRVGEPSNNDTMIIVPTRSLQIIERSLSDGDAEVRLATRANDILVATPRATTFSRLVEGRFPKWRDVFPDRTDGIRIEVTVGPVHSAVRQASIVTSEESRGIDMIFGGGTLVLSGETAEVGSSHVELPISYDGPAVKVSLDHRYVAEFLKVLDQEKTFTVDVKDSESAALFTTNDGYGYVVMPLARDSK